jgi:dCMP deaminase
MLSCIAIRKWLLIVSLIFSCPCLTCSVKIVQVGVSEVVYNVSYSMDTQAEDIMRSGGVRVRQFSPPLEGLIL